MKLHCFHGFLGSERDFDFLRGYYDVQTYDMRELCSGSKESAYQRLEIEKEDALLGYSFGARFALGAFERFLPAKLIMLAGHAGLDEENVSARLEVEDKFVQNIEERDFKDFVAWWNELDLFKNDLPISPKEIGRQNMINMFREFGLSRQKNYGELLRRESEKVMWVCGRQDEKYFQYTKESIEPLGIECVYVEAGHRLLQRKETVLNLVNQALGKL